MVASCRLEEMRYIVEQIGVFQKSCEENQWLEKRQILSFFDL